MLHLPRHPFQALQWVSGPVHTLPQPLHLPVAFATAIAGSIALFNMLVQVGPLNALSYAPSTGMTATEIGATVRGYATQYQPTADPLVTMSDGVQVKSSNYYGVEVDGARYYYRFLGSYSADPISRGEAKDYVNVTTLDAGTQWEVNVYKLK